MSKLQISVIYIFYLVLLLEKVLTSYIVISDSEVLMSNAFLRCREIGGKLLTNKEVFAYADQIKSQCPEVKEFFWIGSFSTITPIMSLEGCYKYENQSVGYFVIPENSVAKCQALCFTEVGIAIKGDVCQCLSLTQINSLTRVDALQCDIITNGEEGGGTGNKMSVYLKQAKGDEVEPLCVYGQCEGRRTSTRYCDTQEKSRIICVFQGRNVVSWETEDWLNVMQTCTTNNSYIISVTEFVENRDSLCGSGQSTLLWTNKRQYINKLTIPGAGDAVKPVCQYGNCVGRRSSVSTLCESQDKSRTVCSFEGIVKELGDTNEWWDAMQMCISKNSYLVSLDKFVANRDSLCPNNQTLRIWTNRRQYMDTIILPGDGIPENYIFNENIVCQSVNMTSFTFVQTRLCNGYQQYGYLCKTESPPSNESSSCIVTIDDEPLKQTSTYRTDLSKSTQTKSLRTTVAGNINVQNTDCKKTSNAGVIVSSTVAVIFALTSIGLFIYIIKRRLAEKESAIRSTYEVVERNRNPEAEMTYDQIITNEKP